MLATAVVPVPEDGVHEHLSLAYAQALESLLADAHDPIRAQVPLPAVAPEAVDAVNTQIPSVPLELHEVNVLYVEHLS